MADIPPDLHGRQPAGLLIPLGSSWNTFAGRRTTSSNSVATRTTRNRSGPTITGPRLSRRLRLRRGTMPSVSFSRIGRHCRRWRRTLPSNLARVFHTATDKPSLASSCWWPITTPTTSGSWWGAAAAGYLEVELSRLPTPKDFRRIVLGMDGAIEGAHMGHPDFRAGGRIFASLHPDLKTGTVKLTPDRRSSSCASTRGLRRERRVGSPGIHARATAGGGRRNAGEAVTLAWQNAVAQPKAARGKYAIDANLVGVRPSGRANRRVG